MPRRVSLPGASELFRPTSSPGAEQQDEAPATEAPAAAPRRAPARSRAQGTTPRRVKTPATTDQPPAAAEEPAKAGPAASGRVRHDEKITVYVSREELLALETGRLALRGDFGLAVDRGRIVRESIALAMADLEHRGADSDLVRRLNGE